MPQYPGLGLPVRERESNYKAEGLHYPIGAHANCRGSTTAPLPVREVAMMSIMETLTDKDDWHKKVFDEEIVAKWREEALGIPDGYFWNLVEADEDRRKHAHPTENPASILNGEAFQYCIQELRTKATHFETTKLVPTLDAYASAVKSDFLVSPQLHQSLLQAFGKLLEDQASSPDWHPNTNGMVHDLVHPSMYPLVYGRTRAFNEEVVGVHDAIFKWAGKGDLTPKEIGYPRDDWGIPPKFWSNSYQWLPSNVTLGESGSVHFTSYINNLHPQIYPDIYRTIESLIETCLPMWDQCLVSIAHRGTEKGTGRTRSRFTVSDQSDENNLNWFPSDPSGCADAEVNETELDDLGYDLDSAPEDILECKWKTHRLPVLSSPGMYQPIDYMPKPGQRLIDRFRESGLQVIVKMASIELTPEKPDFPVGGWHVEGQMNEGICATALYYLDSENITPSSLSFRMQTDFYLNDEDDWNVGQDCYYWMNTNYGTQFGCGNAPCLQNYGSIETREGRLLCFPNVFQHRVSPFHLTDPTKPGHRRFIALWLVDPNRRIVSTANVPPQQMSWWTGSVFGNTPEAWKQARSKIPSDVVDWLQEQTPADAPRLPRELMNMVNEYVSLDSDRMPMSAEEAMKHRAELMKERSAFHSQAESDWQGQRYSFCEH